MLIDLGPLKRHRDFRLLPDRINRRLLILSCESAMAAVVALLLLYSLGALSGFRGSAGAIAGPLLGGVLIATFGLTGAYLFDFLSFAGAVVCVALMRRIPGPEVQPHSPLHDAAIGVRFALSKPELIGT